MYNNLTKCDLQEVNWKNLDWKLILFYIYPCHNLSSSPQQINLISKVTCIL